MAGMRELVRIWSVCTGLVLQALSKLTREALLAREASSASCQTSERSFTILGSTS